MKLDKALGHLFEISKDVSSKLKSEDAALYRKAQSLKIKFNHQTEILRIMDGEPINSKVHGVNERYKDNLAWVYKAKEILDNRIKEYIRDYIN